MSIYSSHLFKLNEGLIDFTLKNPFSSYTKKFDDYSEHTAEDKYVRNIIYGTPEKNDRQDNKESDKHERL